MSETKTETFKATGQTKVDENIEQLKQELAVVEEKVTTNYSLADAYRDASKLDLEQAKGWGDGESACFMSDAWTAAKARGYIK